MNFKRLLPYLIGICVVIFAISSSCSAYKDRQKEIEEGKAMSFTQTLSFAYSTYSFSSMKTAKERIKPYAEKLYKEELAKGKTDKKFKGFTAMGYYADALDKYEDQIGAQYRFAIYMPIILVILIAIALIMSITFGLSAMRPLSFEKKATVFNK